MKDSSAARNGLLIDHQICEVGGQSVVGMKVILYSPYLLIEPVDTVAEWLRRWTANPMCSARVGSNPILVDNSRFSTSLDVKGCLQKGGT